MVGLLYERCQAFSAEILRGFPAHHSRCKRITWIFRIQHFQLSECTQPIHLGHIQVQYYQSDFVCVPGEYFDCLFSVRRQAAFSDPDARHKVEQRRSTASSSSTISAVPEIRFADSGRSGRGHAPISRHVSISVRFRKFFQRGTNTRIVVPLPFSLSTMIAPRCPRTIPNTAAMPSPRPVNLVVKNGSKMRCCVSEFHAAACVRHLDIYKPAGRGLLPQSGFYSDMPPLKSCSPVLRVMTPALSPMASDAFVIIFINDLLNLSGISLDEGEAWSNHQVQTRRLRN